MKNIVIRRQDLRHNSTSASLKQDAKHLTDYKLRWARQGCQAPDIAPDAKHRDVKVKPLRCYKNMFIQLHLAAKANDEQKDSVLFLVGAWLGGGTTLRPHL